MLLAPLKQMRKNFKISNQIEYTNYVCLCVCLLLLTWTIFAVSQFTALVNQKWNEFKFIPNDFNILFSLQAIEGK